MSAPIEGRERDTRAREAQADKYFQEIIEIADAATPETVNVARLRVDSRKFTVARLAPKKYGDHISHNVKGAGSSNFQPQILIQCSSAGDDEGYIDISAAPEAANSLPQQGNGNSLPGSGGRREDPPPSPSLRLLPSSQPAPAPGGRFVPYARPSCLPD